MVELLRVFGITSSTSSGHSADKLGAAGALPSCRRISPGQVCPCPGSHGSRHGHPSAGFCRSRFSRTLSPGRMAQVPTPRRLSRGCAGRGARGGRSGLWCASSGPRSPAPARLLCRRHAARPVTFSVLHLLPTGRARLREHSAFRTQPQGVPRPPRHLASRALLHRRSRRRVGRSREGQPPHPASPAGPALPALRPRRVTCPRPLAPGARVAPP